MKRFLSRNMWIIVLLGFFLLFPQALSSQAKLNNRVIITGIAIDKAETGYEVTAQVTMPTDKSSSSSGGATLNFVTESGVSLIDTIKKVGYAVGEIAGLSHANFILISDSLFEENLPAMLDYFIRDAHVPNSIMLLYCEGSAKDEIKKTNELDLSVGIDLQKVFLYKEESLTSCMMPMQDFINNAFERSKTTYLPKLKIDTQKEGESGGSGGSGSSSSQGSSGSMQSKQGKITAITPIAYFYDGNFVGNITDDNQILSFLLTQNKTKAFNLVINNVNGGEMYKNAQVGLRVGKKTLKTSMDFSKNRPVLKYDFTFGDLKLLEVKNENVAYQGSYAGLTSYLNDTLTNTINEQVNSSIKSLLEDTKKQKIDIFNIADYAYKHNIHKWQEYILSLKNIDDYLNNIDIEVSITLNNFM